MEPHNTATTLLDLIVLNLRLNLLLSLHLKLLLLLNLHLLHHVLNQLLKLLSLQALRLQRLEI